MSERPTWMIVGLGNPGRRYADTRHNIGWMVIDELARRLPGGTERKRFDAVLAEIGIPDGRIVLLKPQTYMNLSGNAVAPAAHWYRVPPARILIVYDELDLPFGQLRLRASGSSGGHKGLASVIERMGTDRIPRLRIGIGRPERGSSVSYVLSRFRPEEARLVPGIIETAADAALAWQRDGIEAAMNRYNRREAQPGGPDPRPTDRDG